MDLHEFFPFWDTLSAQQRHLLEQAAVRRSVKKGTVLHNGAADCVGLLLVQKGRLRVYTVSAEGKEITLYWLYERDICLFSASCAFHSIQFDLSVSAEQDSEFLQIAPDVYQALMRQSAPAANYTNELMAARFSEVMWLLDQILNHSMDTRIAAFLSEQAREDGETIAITHETIARHLGTTREVVTRILKYFQAEGIIALSRSTIHILDFAKLAEKAGE